MVFRPSDVAGVVVVVDPVVVACCDDAMGLGSPPSGCRWVRLGSSSSLVVDDSRLCLEVGNFGDNSCPVGPKMSPSPSEVIEQKDPAFINLVERLFLA